MGAESGRFVLRIPPALHRRLKGDAQRRETSLNQICLERLAGGAPSREVAALEIWTKEFGDGLAGVMVFGSAARGEAGEGSDIDLLLVLKAGCSPDRSLYRRWDRLQPEARIHDGLRVEPQFVALPEKAEDAGGLWLEVALDGILLWENPGDRAVSRLLRGLRLQMLEGRVTRSVVHGHPYWVRKAG